MCHNKECKMKTTRAHNGYNTFSAGDASSLHNKTDNEPVVSVHSVSSSQPVLFQSGVILCLMLCILCGAIGSAAVQVLGGAIPEFELNAWRFGIQWILMIPIMIYKGCELKVPCKKLPLMGLNIMLLNALNVFMFTTYIYLPLGLADGLMNAVILAGNAFLSICIKGDRKLTLYIGVVLCIIGLVLMMQPPFLFSGADLPPPPVTNWTSPCGENFTSHGNTTVLGSSLTISGIMGYVYAVISSGLIIGYYHAISRLVKDVDPFTFAFWNALLGTLLSVLLMMIFEEPTFPLAGFCIAMLLVHCIGTTAVSVAPAWSLQYISPSVCAMINTLKMVIMIVLQYTILYDVKPGLQNWLEILGAIVCFCGMLGGPLTEIIKARH